MIVYRKTGWGFHLLLRAYGSAVVRTAVFGLAALAETLLLYTFDDAERDTWFTPARPYTIFPAFAGMVAFMVIFRQTFSYNRYMEGRVQVAAMSGAWADAAALAASFDSGARAAAPADAAAAAAFRADLAHSLSLAHALCLAALRADADLGNLRAHDPEALPPYDSRATPGFKPSLASYFVVYGRLAQRRAYCAAAKLPVVGGVSAAERRRLGGGLAARRHTVVRGGGGPARGLAALWTSEGGRHYEAAARRPTAAYAAALERVRLRMVEGAFDMPAPIAASFWQAASRGLEAFEHARYLVDTPFPFPWAQLIVATLLVFQLVVPISVACSYTNRPLGCVMAMATTWILWALNETARDIEDPFVSEPNDIALPRIQYQFNEKLLGALGAAPVACRAPTAAELAESEEDGEEEKAVAGKGAAAAAAADMEAARAAGAAGA